MSPEQQQLITCPKCKKYSTARIYEEDLPYLYHECPYCDASITEEEWEPKEKEKSCQE